MSVGGGPDSAMFREFYKEAYNEGVLIVAAAGNDGTTEHDYPASFPHVVSVGAVDQKGVRADFSNYNDQIEIVAPGVSVMSTAPNDSYVTLTGTSMSTPYGEIDFLKSCEFVCLSHGDDVSMFLSCRCGGIDLELFPGMFEQSNTKRSCADGEKYGIE